MRTARQDYKDTAYDAALKHGCNVVQLKYDGWWSRIEIRAGSGQVFSETDRYLPKFDFSLPEQPLNLTLVAELMHGTQWAQDPARLGKFYLFDIWQYEDTPLEAIPYKERYTLLKTVRSHLTPNFDLVQNFHISERDNLWKFYVETEKFEGLVYRKSGDTVGAALHREKYTFTEDLQVVGFREGNGKHEGRLGALLCVDATGVPTDVGGGFDDPTRSEIWLNRDSYTRRWCQVEARKRFASGALRHPNFLSWRPEGWAPTT